MPCFHPVKAWQFKSPGDDKAKILFYPPSMQPDMPSNLQVPCGRCIGCRLERSRQWAIRCVHEASLYEDNCFITLTYSDENLPDKGSLRPRDFVLFMKRLRKKFGKNIRFFHCGEYGEKLSRPHHHACIFNFDFKDKKLWSTNNKQKLYVSETLNKLWGYGYCIIGNVSFESAAYVARYIMKKQLGYSSKNLSSVEKAIERIKHYGQRHPEYITMSRRPGIASAWFDKYKNDVYPKDYLTTRGGVKSKPPKYYDKKLILTDPWTYVNVSLERERRALSLQSEQTPERLVVKEQCQLARLGQLKRNYENDT